MVHRLAGADVRCGCGCTLQDEYDMWELLVELNQREQELLETQNGGWPAGWWVVVQRLGCQGH